MPAAGTYHSCCRCSDYVSDVSQHCMFVHVSQDNSDLRDLINLESATLPKHVLLFIETLVFPFSTFNHFHDGIYWRSSFWCCIPIWYGRRSRHSPTRPTGSTPTDASSIVTVTLSERPIPTPLDRRSPQVPVEIVMVARSEARQAQEQLWAERYAAGNATGHETGVGISTSHDCTLCRRPGNAVSLRWKPKMNKIVVTIRC